MKRKSLLLILIVISLNSLSQTNCFYLKGYINPVATQVNNLAKSSLVELNENNVDVQFLRTNEFPEFGIVAGLERNKNHFEFGVNYSQFQYSFTTSINYGIFQRQTLRSFSANTLGLRLGYGRKLMWSTSVHLLLEVSIPVLSENNMEEDNLLLTYNSLGETITVQEQFSESINDVFITPELFFNTTINFGFYLRYGLKFTAFDPALLYSQKIEYTNGMNETRVGLDQRLGHDRIVFFMGIGYNFELNR